jgi:hypothetical protein
MVTVFGADGTQRVSFRAYDDKDIYGTRVSLGKVFGQ